MTKYRKDENMENMMIENLPRLIKHMLAVKTISFKMKNPFVVFLQEVNLLANFLAKQTENKVCVLIHKGTIYEVHEDLSKNKFIQTYHQHTYKFITSKFVVPSENEDGIPVSFSFREDYNDQLYELVEKFYKKNIFLTEEIIKKSQMFIQEMSESFPGGLTKTECVNLRLFFQKMNDAEFEICPKNFLIKRQKNDEILFQPQTNNPKKELLEIIKKAKERENTFFLEKKEKLLQELQDDNKVW
jgi:hypothetical protein